MKGARVSTGDLFALRAVSLSMLVLCALFARGCFGVAEARADERSTVTTLMRAAVSEATWLERDHRALLHVLGRRADSAGVSVEAMALRYVSIFKARVPADRLWILQLEPECNRPEAWPAHLDWEAHRMQCELTVERVRAFMAGDSIDPCAGRAWHWGAMNLPRDIDRAERAGWEVVRCDGPTANRFYGRTSRATHVVSAQEASGR